MSVTPVTMILFSRGIFLTLIVLSNFQYSLLFLAFFGASASGAINTICKGYLAFFPQNLQHPKVIYQVLQKNLELCYSAILPLELDCNTILNINDKYYYFIPSLSYFLLNYSELVLSLSLSLSLCSSALFLLSSVPKPIATTPR